MEEKLPAAMKRYIADNKIKFYIIDAVKIAHEIGLGGRINMIMQSAFFALTQIIPVAQALGYLKDAVEKSYGNKGQSIVTMNNAAIDQGAAAAIKIDVPAAWGSVEDQAAATTAAVPEFISNILIPMSRQEGDKLPVSAFIGMDDGTFPSGTSAYEKRGIAIDVPEWQPENCIQCNQCAFVCPHAAIRPALLSADEVKAAPVGFIVKPAVGVKDQSFHIAVSPLDCAGCGNCAQVLPCQAKSLDHETARHTTRKNQLMELHDTAFTKSQPSE